MRGTLIVLALLLAGAAPAAAASTRAQIYKDCMDGSLDGTYTPAEIRDARENMPSDVAEYSDCSSILRKAELNPVAPTPTPSPPPDSSGTGGGSAPAATATPEPTRPPELNAESESDQRALDGAENAGSQPVTVSGEPVLAGITPTSDLTNDLPGPLVVALIALGAAGLALCLPPLRRRAALLKRRR